MASGPAGTLSLYATVGCHLCDEAMAVIGTSCPELLSELQVVDIADDPELFDRYGTRIPVLRSENGDAELDWPFEPTDLLDFIHALDR